MAPRPTPPAELVVTQVRSAIGTKPKHRATLRALGLRGIGQSNVLADRPEIRGMLARVSHLVSVSEHAPAQPARAAKSAPDKAEGL
jgi:large subunit ribosomal protein L30